MEHSPTLGEILIGAMIIDAESQYDIKHINTIMRPDRVKMDVEVNILGLRGL